MFTTAPFAIAKTWKPRRCPSADEWIEKLWQIYTVEYYSAMKRRASESVLMMWVEIDLLCRVNYVRKGNIDIVY